MANEKIDSIANRLRKGMFERNIRQVDLARLTNISKCSLSQYLSGKNEPKSDRIYLIAKALDINESWLMGYDVPMDKPRHKAETINNDLLIISDEEKFILESYRGLKTSNRVLIHTLLKTMAENKDLNYIPNDYDGNKK